MKLKLKNPNAGAGETPGAPLSTDASTPISTTPVSAKPAVGLKIKLKPVAPIAASAPENTADSHGDAPKAKRKYNKKAKLDDDGNSGSQVKASLKKRAREDGEDLDSPATKRKPKPTQKSLEMADESDDDDPVASQPAPKPRPVVNRTQSIKLKIKPKDTSQSMPTLQRTSTTLLKVKGAGKPPVRPFGVGYDSEAEEAEADPAIESQFILRMQPGEDCDLLRKSIEEKTIGKSQLQGGPGVHFRFFDREGRRAMVTIRGTMYAASMVELPAVIESLKSWNKKDWVKTADVCQMLLVLGKVQNEEEAKKYPRPSYIDPDSHRYPHGLTPPMRWVRKLRFRPRKSYLDVERAEAQMNRLLAEDENAESTKFELIDSDDESEEESSEDDQAEEEFQEEAVEEMDAADLAAMLAEGLDDNENLEIQGNEEELSALLGGSDNTVQVETPTTAHEVAMHALSQHGNLVVETETAASTPAAATSADDDDDDDDDDADSDEDEVVDEAAAAEERRQETLRAEIEELERALAENVEALHRQTNKLFQKRMTATIEKQKADIAIKKKQLNEDDND